MGDLQASARELTCRGCEDICEIIILCTFSLKLGRGWGAAPRLGSAVPVMEFLSNVSFNPPAICIAS